MKKKFIQVTILLLSFSFMTLVSSNKNNTEEQVEVTYNHPLTSGVIASIEPNLLNSNNIKQAKEEEEDKEQIILSGYTTTRVNIRMEGNVESEIICTIDFNTKISYSQYNKEWCKVSYDNINWYYMKKDYISQYECDYILYQAPNNSFKSYMDYRTIVSKSSDQFLLQQYAYDGNYGIRMVSNRFCIAMGNGFNVEVGDYVDLILDNGNIIKCIIGDIKADVHTDSTNMITIANGCISEFIVNKDILDTNKTGDISNVCEEWKSSIKEVKVYNKNYLEED